MQTIITDLCVIGAGSAGLSVAAGASQMGLNVVLIEKEKMGGDCLNYGCVPSKSILAAAKVADTMRHADKFGITGVSPAVDYVKLRDHIRSVIDAIAPHDSVERFESLGVTVVLGEAHFIGRNTVEVNNQCIKAKRIVIATGARATIPVIPGIEKTPHFTNKTIFDLAEKPAHLIVIGGGPIGCELAQAHALLGAKVTILEGANILPKDDPECVDRLRQRFLRDGIDVHEKIRITNVEGAEKNIMVTVEQAEEKKQIQGSHLLLATGRRANIENLDCEKAGVATDSLGIIVDTRFCVGIAAGFCRRTRISS